ncbi:MAG: glycoside hydrolase family 13 protein [Clostridia bacterium]|nr:glycoside hydrolase family 13 protein [Clostridia bacterium]
MQLFHDSRDPFYRSPGGALPCGSAARLRLSVRGGAAPDEVVLRVWREGEERLPMAVLPGGEGGERVYEVLLPAGDTPMLVWYRFEVMAGGQRAVYGNAWDNLGGVGSEGREDSYQLTVYDAAFDPPHWLREGVMYQIMVDRFYNGDPTGSLFKARQDIFHHTDWYEAPGLTLSDQGDNLANDFYGGNLAGIRAKLPYLASLGVSVLYLNPIFRAYSNHKYDTGDYETIDPMFGDSAAFSALCADAAEAGIRVMLDGVFSHIGADSRYFNLLGTYPVVGACQSKESPYYRWFTFYSYPDAYDCWWGFRTLPNVREEEPCYVEYMLTGPDAIVPGWLKRGASAWRLDVADELPMPFLRTLRRSAKAARADAVVLGEVWEDVSNKVAYGSLRSYVLGDTLDSAMNYPLREALIDFLLGRTDAAAVKRRLDALAENYPKPFFYSLMNLLGSHDRARILNVLAGCEGESLPREQRRALTLSAEQRAVGQRRTRLMLRLIAALPGMPCVYYGDEAGMEGANDPYCRAAYPWGREDEGQLDFFRAELVRRRQMPVLTRGECLLLAPCPDVLVALRYFRDGKDAFGENVQCTVYNVQMENAVALCAINRADAPREVRLPVELAGGAALVDESGRPAPVEDGHIVFTLEATGSAFLAGG